MYIIQFSNCICSVLNSSDKNDATQTGYPPGAYFCKRVVNVWNEHTFHTCHTATSLIILSVAQSV